MPSFVLIGHSHITGIARAAITDGRDVRIFAGGASYAGARASVATELTPELDAALTADAVVLSCIGGNAHNVLAIVAYQPPFDFVCSEAPHLPLDPDAEIVSEAALRDSLRRRAGRYMELFHEVVPAARGLMFHSESPPPSPADDRFLAGIARLTSKPPATPNLRYKMWRLHSAIVRETCAETGVTFIPHPPESTDEAGMLLPEYYLNQTHANAAYGRLVWRQLEALL